MIINPQEFLLREIPDFHPLSNDYISFWRNEKKKSIEGYWYQGYYMPPNLYFYSNFAKILLNTKQSRKIKKVGTPRLRDLEWMLFREWLIVRGFSGFSDDNEFTSDKIVLEPNITVDLLLQEAPHTLTQINNEFVIKEYKHPRHLLEMRHSYHKGYPIFTNPAYNFMVMGSRGSGKTYSFSTGIVLPTWLFNGITRYGQSETEQSILITVGAEDSKYSTGFLSKTKFALEHLPGNSIFQGRTYPSPFYKEYKGSWAAGSGIIAEYKQKTSGGWEIKGTRATINHRTFKDNPYAEQGTRPYAIFIEECGHASNLEEIYKNTKDNLRDGLWKTGTLAMLGTGGDMSSGTLDASKMYYEPEAYDIFPTEDVYENRGYIGFFIPAYLALDNHKNEQGFTNIEAAKDELLKAREKASKASSDSLAMEIQYRPIVPSEIFLSKESTIFPTIELRRRLSELQTSNQEPINVNLFFDPESSKGVSYEVDLHATPINSYPWNKDNIEGAITIYEFPHEINTQVPEGMYISGPDPYRTSTNSGSFASIYVLKTSKCPHLGYNEVVASYVGRPYDGVNKVNEILHKLSLFYGNAKIYFENAVGNTKDYFEKVKRLDLLARQPVNVLNKKASYDTRESVIYGYPMSNEKIKWEALQYVRSFLLEERGQNRRNLDVIPDKFLLQQLIAFNLKGNFDAVMGFVGCIIGLNEIHISSKRKEENSSKALDEFETFIVKNKYLFNEQTTTTATILR